MLSLKGLKEEVGLIHDQDPDRYQDQGVAQLHQTRAHLEDLVTGNYIIL